MERKFSPVVILPGINHSPTYLFDENGNHVKDAGGRDIGDTLIIPDKEKFKAHLPEIAKAIGLAVLTQCSGNTEKAVYDAVCDALWIQKCGDDGNFVNNLITKRWNHSLAELTEDEFRWVNIMVPLKELVDEIGKENIYFFTFNLVGDPMKTADELEDYIRMVREQTGYDKVTLLPVSLGGTILTAYLDAYGHRYVDRIVNAVACLDGTDIVADLFDMDFNTSESFLHHEFLPRVLKEMTGKGTAGYAVNSILHLLPEEAFNSLLRGAITAALDTIMINCPQIWAMLPSYRYEETAEHYLNVPEKAGLRKRTDRFQQARLNLKNNILAAVADGVRVDSISGSNLDFGEPEYTFFSAVASAEKYNTDGIINLSSTTLGATGAPHGANLGDGYVQAKEIEGHPGYSYISPDRRIDVSTALLPDHTWIFLNQHHEVGRNDVVLNLFRSIILGELDDVHSDPVNHPQFNYSCNTYHLRRWLLGDAEKALSDIESDTLHCPPSIEKELREAIAEGRTVLRATVADAEKAAQVKTKLEKVLARLGRFTPKNEPSEIQHRIETAMENISSVLLKYLGGGSIFEKLFRK